VPQQARRNWVFQRDAVMTALDLAGIPRGELTTPPQPGMTLAPGQASIFEGSAETRALEDMLLQYDLDGAADWTLLGPKRPYPAKTYINGETKLTVVLANKLPLEAQLGVDLIYVNETLQSVIFVQYKMMEGREGVDGYRPNNQFHQEVARMDAAAVELAK
jgi:hypothetical protein